MTAPTIQWRAKLESETGYEWIRGADLIEFNRKLKETEGIRSIELEYNNTVVVVDLFTGAITIDGNLVDLHFPEGFNPKQHNLRWINFRRMEGRLFGGKKGQEVKGYGIGWQTTWGGKNIQRVIFYELERLEKKIIMELRPNPNIYPRG